MVNVKDKGLSNNPLINALLVEDAPRWTNLPTYGLGRPVMTYYLDPDRGRRRLERRRATGDAGSLRQPRGRHQRPLRAGLPLQLRPARREEGDEQLLRLPGTAGEHEDPDDFHDFAGGDQIEGSFNIQNPAWTGMTIGGTAFQTMLHEVMHGLGLDHPHEYLLLPGVPDGAEFGSLGTANLNQIVYTNMSYNRPWAAMPPAGTVLPGSDFNLGGVRGPGALDIAALQYLYGKNTTYRTGNDSYRLSDMDVVSAGPAPQATSWLTIWDAGGADQIAYSGFHNATIDLRPATLRVEEGGGGFLSFVTRTDGIVVHGGFTIANGWTSRMRAAAAATIPSSAIAWTTGSGGVAAKTRCTATAVAIA